jgi:hypothetical protein
MGEGEREGGDDGGGVTATRGKRLKVKKNGRKMKNLGFLFKWGVCYLYVRVPAGGGGAGRV